MLSTHICLKRTTRFKLSAVPYAVVVSHIIICCHLLTSVAVCMTYTDTFRQRLANGEVDLAMDDVFITIAIWNDAIILRCQLIDGDSPVVSAAKC